MAGSLHARGSAPPGTTCNGGPNSGTPSVIPGKTRGIVSTLSRSCGRSRASSYRSVGGYPPRGNEGPRWHAKTGLITPHWRMSAPSALSVDSAITQPQLIHTLRPIRMPAQPNRRMPLSCEPCRERKIRCPRTANSPGGPCATCVRRGVPTDQCVFLRDIHVRRASRPRTPAADATAGDDNQGASNSELLERIRKLESLVVGNATNNASRMSAEAVTVPSPLDSHGGGQVDTHAPGRVTRGSLIKTASGHERYEPLSSKWSSVLANSPMGHGVSVDALTPGSASEFPFTTGRAHLEEALAALPAMSHCDELKDVYMSVFAPVSKAMFSRLQSKSS